MRSTAQAVVTGTLSVAERSYPTSEVGGGGAAKRRYPMPLSLRPGAAGRRSYPTPPRPRPGAVAGRSNPMSEAREAAGRRSPVS